MIQTHTTRGLDENDRVTTDGIEPGLTLRDIRFAVQLENLLDSPNNLIARVPDSDSTNYRSTDRAVAWQELLSEYPFRALEPTDCNSDNSNNSNNSDNFNNSDNSNNSDNTNNSNNSNSLNDSSGSNLLETLSILARQ